LDTNVCIYFLNGTFPGIRRKLEEHEYSDVKIPSVVAAELYYGASKSEKQSHNIARFDKFLSVYEIVPFALSSARIYGDIRAELERKGQRIGWNDLIIAAVVLAHGGVLVTRNTGEFSRIGSIALEDWTIS
jgi:tRNA(fMet)-specific endonuclease VapC